jgi:hypothetical protein
VPVPVADTLPGVRVNVHVPDAGNPLNATDPVATAQVGWVGIPAVGVPGVPGATLITTLADANEVHPAAFVTV